MSYSPNILDWKSFVWWSGSIQSAKTREKIQIEVFIYKLLDNLIFLGMQTSQQIHLGLHTGWFVCKDL